MKHLLVILALSAACGGGTSAVEEPSGPGAPDQDDGAGDSEAAAGAEATDEAGSFVAVRATGRNFSIPVPAGYRQVTTGMVADMMRDEVLTPGGVILMASASEAGGRAPGSIVVSPTAADISSDAVDAGLCGQLAAIVARQHEAEIERSGMVELPWGGACQWVLRVGGEEDRKRVGTVFAAHAEDWIVTCNFDESDEGAAGACDQVLGGWAFAS